MSQSTRREFLRHSLAATGAAVCGRSGNLLAADAAPAGGLRLGTFAFDVTPPLGHSCCGGWIKPIEVVDDPLEAIGLVLLGAGPPVVICAVDWTGLLNEAHVAWRRALADAAGTTPERVAVQCVHQHNAPMACLEAERVVQAQGDLPHILDLKFFERCLEAGRKAVTQAIATARPLTHLAVAQAKVSQVASNRRVARDAAGNVTSMRGSSCQDANLRALPEGLIDPWLKTVAFYHEREKVAACHYYATHPMSYYADGRATSDFAGLARKRRQQDEPGCRHLYFTGCSGNLAAGKYNDGSPAMRPLLTKRMYDGLVQSEQLLRPVPITQAAWKTHDILPPPRYTLRAETLQQLISERKNPVVTRNRSAYMLSFLRRAEQRIPLVLSCLHVNDARLLHLPGECFVEYQLRAQQLQPGCFVATAAYGDTGTWYIPTQDEYPRGGYEPSVAFCSPQIDALLTAGMERVLG